MDCCDACALALFLKECLIISNLHTFCREFIKSWLPRFREENPQLEINEVLKRGGHPFLDASFSKFYAFDGAAAAALVAVANLISQHPTAHTILFYLSLYCRKWK